MVPASGNSLSPPAISRGPAFSLTLLCGQIPGEGDNMRIRLRPVRWLNCQQRRNRIDETILRKDWGRLGTKEYPVEQHGCCLKKLSLE